jgi:hypothetical protein
MVENKYTDKISWMIGGTKIRDFKLGTCDLNLLSLTQWSLVCEPSSRLFSYLVIFWLFILNTTHTSVQQEEIPLDLLLCIWLRVQ